MQMLTSIQQSPVPFRNDLAAPGSPALVARPLVRAMSQLRQVEKSRLCNCYTLSCKNTFFINSAPEPCLNKKLSARARYWHGFFSILGVHWTNGPVTGA